MKRVLILCDPLSIETKQFDAEKFCKLLNRNENLHVEYAFYHRLVYFISSDRMTIFNSDTGVDIAEYDVVYRKRSEFSAHHAISCAHYVHMHSKVFIDSEFTQQLNANAHKLVEHVGYAVNKLPFPETMIVHQGIADVALRKWNDLGLGFPAVLKSLTATRGGQNFLVNSAEEVHEILQKSSAEHPDYALQPFVENDSDYRFLVLGYETALVIQRSRNKNSTSHTNNTSQGADAELIPLESVDAAAIQLANSAARAFGREVAGVDIMIDKKSNRPVILEVNRSPQIEQGAFVEQKAEKLAGFLERIPILN